MATAWAVRPRPDPLEQPPRALAALKRGLSSSAAPSASASVQAIWRSVGAVCFDVDSTVCEEEGIDVLAEHCGAGQAVKEWTTKCAPPAALFLTQRRD
jgi:phosphoserine phosphatase